MLSPLLAIILILPIISCAHICEKDGLYQIPEDRTSYLECINGKSYFRSCPRGGDNLYMLFNGQTCVEGFEGSKFNCPQEKGKYRFIGNDKQYWDCVNGQAVMKNCQHGEFFDGLKCVVKRTDQSDEAINGLMRGFKCPRSNGQYINPDDRHSYFECQNFIAALIDCPREPLRHRIGYQKHIHRRRQVFDGERCANYVNPSADNRSARQAPDDEFDCPVTDGYYADPRDPNYFYICRGEEPEHQRCPVDNYFNETLKRCVEPPAQPGPDIAPLGRPGIPYCPPDSTYDPTTGRCRGEDLVDPINRPVAVDTRPFTRCPSGSTYDPPSGRCVQELLVDPIERDRVHTGTATRCPDGSTYDQRSGRCQIITLVDPIREQVLETERVRECPPGYQYDRSLRECKRIVQIDPIGYCPSGQRWDAYRRVCIPNQPIDRRYRRNGRVELEDGVNVIVDTWNELDWKWERNLNGEKILPERNGWVDWNVRPWDRRGGYQGNYAGRNGE